MDSVSIIVRVGENQSNGIEISSKLRPTLTITNPSHTSSTPEETKQHHPILRYFSRQSPPKTNRTAQERARNAINVSTPDTNAGWFHRRKREPPEAQPATRHRGDSRIPESINTTHGGNHRDSRSQSLREKRERVYHSLSITLVSKR